MIHDIQDWLLGSPDTIELEHRCYNGGCLMAGFGCLLASGLNTALGMPPLITVITFLTGTTYLWLYVKSRRSQTYQPVLWLFILIGVILLTSTWIYNAGINGSVTFVSMVALVALTVVLKRHRLFVASTVFLPIMSALFLLEYLYPELILEYKNPQQRFMDVYLTFVVCTAVILSIIALILQSYDEEKKRLNDTNLLLEEKMEMLNRSNLDLENALAKVRTLSGLLPICASCKNIRDDQGYWNQIEGYIQKHSEAKFSHGICPDCTKKLYPEEYAMMQSKDAEQEDETP
jgi:hypothetical protein